MTWNWQLKKWPNFTWDKEKMARAETLFMENAGITLGMAKHLNVMDKETFFIDVLSQGALKTSEIEGEILNRESVQSSIQKNLGLSFRTTNALPAEAGIAEMMVDLYKNIPSNLTNNRLFRWHEMIMSGRRDIDLIGHYRTHEQPMQIVSGPSYAPKIHFEAPPSSSVPEEMTQLIQWVDQTKPGQKDMLPAITRAGIAHIWFESIHPFEDGNGRIGRALSEMILAQGFSLPTFTSIAPTLQRRQKDYYKELEHAHRDLDLTDWLLWFATVVLESQKQSAAHVEFLLEKTRLLEKLKGALNDRQEKALLRMFKEGPEGFIGGLSAKNYATITGAPSATSTRDLSDLVHKGALYKTGVLKSTRYFLKIPMHTVEKVTLEDLS